MNPFEIKSKITKYNSSPGLFSNDEISELTEYAKIYNIPFKPAPFVNQESSSKKSGILSQFGSGFSEGLLGPLAFGGWAEEPESESQSIANSMGHLLGFALPLGGKVLGVVGKGLGAVGKLGGASKAGRALNYSSSKIEGASKMLQAGDKFKVGGLGEIPLKSIPMIGADYVQEKAKSLLMKSGFEVAKHLNKVDKFGKASLSSKLLNTGFQAGHLAVASGISGSFNGEDDDLNNIIFGAVAGGAFGGMGNFIATGKLVAHPSAYIQKKGRERLFTYAKEFTDANSRRIATAVGGSLFQGGMSTIQGAPTSVQLYEYLLGGFFGYNAQGVNAVNAHEYIGKFSKKGADGKNLYTLEDYRSLTDKKHGFETLSKESQEIVSEYHAHYLGEYYNRKKDSLLGLSEAGAGLSETVSPLRERLRSKIESAEKNALIDAGLNEKTPEEIKSNKKTEIEIAKIKVDSIDKVFTQEQKNHDYGQLEKSLYEQIIKGEETKESRQITDKLTKEERKKVLQGDSDPLGRHIKEFFGDNPYEKVQLDIESIIHSANKVSESQPETTSVHGFKIFLNQLQEKTKNLDYSSEAVINETLEIYKNQKVEGTNSYNVLDFINKVKTKFPGLDIDKPMKQGLVRTFNQLKHSGEFRPIITLDSQTGEQTLIKHKNILNKIVKIFKPTSADEVINREKGLWSEKITVLEFGEVVKKNSRDGSVATVKPYAVRYNYETEKYEPQTTSSDWITMIKALWHPKGNSNTRKGNFYLKAANKDNGVERVSKIHPKTEETPLQDIFNKVAGKDNTKEATRLRNLYEYDKEIWYESIGVTDKSKLTKQDQMFLDKVYQDSFKSNYLYESEYSFSTAAKRIKREPLFASNSALQQDPELFRDVSPNGKINVFVVEAEKGLLSGIKKKLSRLTQGLKPETYKVKLANGEVETRAWGSKVDGWVVMHSELYKSFIKANGLDESTSHIKPQVAVEIDGQLFMIKAGIHPSRAGYDKAMKNPNSIIVVTSSAKAFPKSVVPYTMHAKKNAKGESSFSMSGKKAHFQMDLKDFRINPSVYNDSHALFPTTIKKQVHSFMDALTMSPEGFTSAMNAMLDIPINGTESTNNYIKALKKNRTAERPRDFEISELSDKDFIEVINNIDHPLHKDLNMEIFKNLKQMERDSDIQSENIGEIVEYASSFEKMYTDTGFNPMTEIVHMNLYQRAVHQYRLNRFTQPKWKESASGWVSGVDPLMESITGGIRENQVHDFWNGKEIVSEKVGHVKIGYSHRKMKIKWLDNKSSTLEKGYEAYLAEKASSNPDKIVLARMRQRLLLAVMRVPANAVSGTRALLFDGFVENDLNMSDYGVYMRARDHFYIDGADVDGDKVFFYQGMPKEFMKDLIRNDSFLERQTKDNKGIEHTVIFENKDEQFNKIFKSEYSEDLNRNGISEKEFVEKNPISQWSPGAIRKAGQSSYAGKQGMGTVVNTKSFMNMVLADVINKNGGSLNIDIHDKNGNVIGKLTGQTDVDYLKSPEGYYVMGVEASSRTADSANFYRMANPREVQDILFQSAFKNLRFERTENSFKQDKRTSFDDLKTSNFENNPDLLIEKATFDKLRNSAEYGYLYELNSKLYGYNHKEQRNWTPKEVQETLNNTPINDRHMSSIISIAAEMKKGELDLNPLKNFNFEALKANIKELRSKIIYDKQIKEFALRKSLFIDHKRVNVDYNQIYNFMSKNFPGYETNVGKKAKSEKLPHMSEDVSKQNVSKRPYSDFINEGINRTLPKELQEAFDKMYSPIETVDVADPAIKWITRHAPATERDFIVNDTYDIWSSIALLKSGKRLKSALGNAGFSLEGTSKDLKGINNIALKILSGTKLTELEKRTQARFKKDIDKVIDKYEKTQNGSDNEIDIFDSTQLRSKAQNESAVLMKDMAMYANEIKLFFNRDYVKKEKPVYENQETANRKIHNYANEIIKKSEELGLNPEVMLDYFYTQLLSSIKPQLKNFKNVKNDTMSRLDRENSQYNKRLREAQKKDASITEVEKTKDHVYAQTSLDNLNKNYNMTSTPRFMWSLSAIPKSIKSSFLRGYADAFDQMNSLKKPDLKTIANDVTLKEPEVIKKENAPKDLYEERIHTKEKIEDAIKPLEIDRLSKDPIDKENLRMPEDIRNKVLPSIKKSLERDTTNMLTTHIEELYTLMKSEGEMTGTTSIRDATFQDLRNFDRFLKEIVNAGAKDMKYKTTMKFIFPYSVGEKMNNQDMSNLYRMNIPIKNIDGSIGEAQIGVPMSAMTYLAKSSNAIRRFNDATANSLVENLFDNLAIKAEVEALPDGVNLFNKFFEIAIKEGNIKSNQTREDPRQAFYKEELASSKDLIERFATDELRYPLTRKGETIQVSGREIVNNITEQLKNYMQVEMYESWIGAGMLNSKGAWTKIDFSKIDKKPYIENEPNEFQTNLHDIIKFDKNGKFDLDNFYNKTVRLASEGSDSFSEFMGNRNNPFSVELMNRVNYEILLEQYIDGLITKTGAKKYKPLDPLRAKERQRYRSEEKTSFKGTGEIKGFYFPQMMHDVKKLNPYIIEQQNNLQISLENMFTRIEQKGKLKDNGTYKIQGKYTPKPREMELALGVGPKPTRYEFETKGIIKTKKELIDYYLQKQSEDFQMFTSSALENSLHHSEYAIHTLNSEYRDTRINTKETATQIKPGSGQARGDVPMPFFSYSPDVLTNYTKNWTNAYFNNLLSIMGKRVIDKYKKASNVPNEVKTEWGLHLKDYLTGQMGFGKTIPLSHLGLTRVQQKRITMYVDDNKKEYDKSVLRQKKGVISEADMLLIDKVENYKEKLTNDLNLKRKNGIDVYLADYLPTSFIRKLANKMPVVKDMKIQNFTYSLTDQFIIDWMNTKSQSLLTGYNIPRPKWYKNKFGTPDKPRLPFLGELPTSEKARERVLNRTLTNIGNFEAKMSLISLLSHPKTALGNILGGSMNTISNNGVRNFARANDTKWLLSNVFKGATLKDGTKVTDRNTIYRLISEHGALESFYVTEASMDKSLSGAKLGPFIREMAGIAFKNPNYKDSQWKDVAKKHKVWDSIVASGGYFMRTSETKLRADAYLAHYLTARESYGQFIPNMKFDNPYLIKHALKGVEATQFLYHNVRRPEISTSAMGKMMTRFQPFMWNSLVFRKELISKANRYGMTDKKSVDRLKRVMAQDLIVMGLANIFVASIFDSILPPPLSYLQDTTDWLFGDEKERANAFFSSYPHPALAPLQVVTAPVHRLWMPAMTAMINGDYDRLTSYYIHTMYPFGRLGRSLYKTYQAPEMFSENMLGIPVHKLGSKLRKARKKNEEEKE